MNTTKMLVNLPDDLVKYLQEKSNNDNSTFTDVLCDCIRHDRFFFDHRKKGYKILVEKDDDMFEVKFMFERLDNKTELK